MLRQALQRRTGVNSSRRLRIAFVGARGIPHTYGGAESVLSELAPRLATRGHNVTVYCRSVLFTQRPNEYRSVRLIYLPSIETKALGTPTHTLLSMLHVLFRKTDVIIAWNLPSAFLCIIPRFFRKSVGIMVDGLDWKRDKWGRVGKAYLYLSARYVGSICPNGVITDTLDMHRVYMEEFGTPTAYISIGGNVASSTDPNVIKQYGLEPFHYYLIASRLVPENNADLILDAFANVASKRLLVVAGDANYRSGFAERLRQTQDPRVRFLGHVENPEHVKELHCNAYAYVHGHSAGGTNPSLLKALGCGNCILALNTPSNSEVLGDYGMVFERDVVDLEQKLQYIEDHSEVAVAYRNRAPERIHDKYDWEKITDQYEQFFLDLAVGGDPTLRQPISASLSSSKLGN